MASVETIEKALREKMTACSTKDENYSFSLTMKQTGNVVTVQRRLHKPHFSCGHWHGSSAFFAVFGDGIEGEKTFRTLGTLAKAIHAGYIR